MLTPVTQRWRAHRASYRPVGEPIEPRHYEVAMVNRAKARAFVAAHHYSHAWPAERRSVGLWRAGTLVGVAVASVPMHARVLADLPGEPGERAELGRLVLLDDVPSNGETWFLARAFEILAAEGLTSLVAFSDPLPRTDDAGAVTFRGHIGNVYQASNARYVGRAAPSSLHLLPWGEVLSARAIQKVRARERGWRYATALMQRAGAPELTAGEDARAWMRTWLPRVTRTVRHPGNHRYELGLTRASRRAIGARGSLPYPKFNLFGEAS